MEMVKRYNERVYASKEGKANSLRLSCPCNNFIFKIQIVESLKKILGIENIKDILPYISEILMNAQIMRRISEKVRDLLNLDP